MLTIIHADPSAGPFRLDTEDGLLLRGGKPVNLGRRPIALLRAMVERQGALLSKDALIEAGWPGKSVEESNLTVQIAALRRALGTTPGGDRWIETMPGRGYRFIGPVAPEARKATPENLPHRASRWSSYRSPISAAILSRSISLTGSQRASRPICRGYEAP